jgi:hypothetical protein
MTITAFGWIFYIRRHLSWAARHDTGAAGPDRGGELPPDGFKQPKRQQSVGNACGIARASRSQARTRPLSAKRRFACRVRREQSLRREAIGFGEHDRERSSSSPRRRLAAAGSSTARPGSAGAVCETGSTVTSRSPPSSTTTRMTAQDRSSTPASRPRPYSVLHRQL